jgi:hypothetical protein
LSFFTVNADCIDAPDSQQETGAGTASGRDNIFSLFWIK